MPKFTTANADKPTETREPIAYRHKIHGHVYWKDISGAWRYFSAYGGEANAAGTADWRLTPDFEPIYDAVTITISRD